MPVDDDEWSQGSTSETVQGQVLDFLRNNDDQGWTSEEIARRTGFILGDNIDNNFIRGLANGFGIYSIHSTLEELAEEGKIEKRTIPQPAGSEEYYRSING